MRDIRVVLLIPNIAARSAGAAHFASGFFKRVQNVSALHVIKGGIVCKKMIILLCCGGG